MLVREDGRKVYIATYEGALELWTRGASAPVRKIEFGGMLRPLRGRAALLAPVGSDKLLLVETNGRILLLDAMLNQLWSHTLFGVGKETVKEAQPPRRGQQSMIAFATSDGRDVGIGYEKWGPGIIGFLFPLDSYLNDSEINKVRLTNETWTVVGGFRWKFKSAPYIKWISNDLTGRIAEVNDQEEITDIALCGDYTIIGLKSRSIMFVKTKDLEGPDSRIRSLRETTTGIFDDRIVDVGCVGNKYVFSVAMESELGQLQLWDLENKTLLDWVDEEKGGHFGIAYRGISSRGTESILTLGHAELRLWSVRNGKLSLLGLQYFEENELGNVNSDAVALPDGSFLVWDGVRIQELSADGSKFRLFAGPKPVQP